ncbi:hypothetical protein A2V61_03235 [Candidatus Woesebacteria bacterium RBG_19FT_COMBO_47_8]|uniref:Uncharacterized protein n=1 Tax=Candidatus Woesebacteria bacterium RBG_13_46_13 TaxID=1802479 RepID=A0A1F7X5H2_9BACT|nr:MAG: hypothetical protein A2Y68_02640 [Candidatus Woesebacteria bacterium RBG_13_46_13]OGM16701.1 MAG: hypothetical protein A2V61_03235 [Candidatus Woesebacteria bacterium RBG_19FT_COMBO_47_8]HJX59101.1 DUF5667 domain-containing protein [Patescibacteria group bacterium]
MGIKRILLLVLVFFFFGLFLPKSSKAIDLQQALTSENSIVVKIQEGIEYFFAFSLERKVGVLEKHAEKRLSLAQGYAQEGNNEKMKDLLQNYLEIKEKQNNLLGKTDDGETLESVAERTIEQQKTMEEIKNEIDEGEKGNVIEVQEQVVNQVAERIVEVNGTEGQTEFFQKVEHVWAPGTGPGGEAGVVIEGGTMQFAPGTSAGGSGGSDIQNTVIEGGGDSGGGTTIEGGNPGTAPGTSSGGEGGGTTVVGE